MPNRLADATSPYLLQHADNPIDWYPWGPEAFEEAARRDVPVLLSVGYAACHWCHVMAHESFEDADTAAQVNAGFVAIKVDREERPDIDAVYMAATQAATGQGGWPMTCFLTPVGEPFSCGTYYPPTPRHGLPGFRQLLDAVTTAWTQDGERVRSSAGEFAARLADGAGATLPPAVVDDAALDAAAAALGSGFDAVHGGFGGAPKFPPSMVLEFLARHHERTGSADALARASVTAERMARGGLYDQLAGGFARYSVDARWIVPHFEKMLYDNALLLRAYAHLARLPDAGPLPGRVAAETAAFLLTDLRTPEGGFAAALDADADGAEGLTYAWTPAQLRDVLGDEDGAWAADLLTVTAEGTFEHGSSTLQLPADPDDPARWARVRAALLAARARRPQPARDDKVVTAWNGLAIQALAEAGAALGHPEWVAAAAEAAELLLSLHVVDGRLRRSSRAGAVGAAAGLLEDHACLADALLALHQATGAPRWLDAATGLLDLALQRFSGEEPGTFFDTADDAEELLHRPRELTDNASPCGSSALASALVTASVLAADGGRYRDAAEAALRSVGTLASTHPRFAGHWLTVAEAVARGPLQVAVTGPDDAARAALLAHARRIAAGGTVVVAGEPDADGVPLLADRPLVDGGPAAYVCRGVVCDRPVTTTEELTAALLLRP
ncbi:thioredoxin domain-containing protein [Pseudonocardia petroleophila]|uniref:Thioredoxin domain-containing protein n=1 Tax=Pseudonocardia petroleophila TaxID=37331 RepID=A0A7G7MK71_9PSEU|nr:thioredoxin domain-containing protein [Pseudonocardia petroleophila]QNG53182.1 thioredoxin domain-containing protein [Pseudonocardia petroleophila]